MSQFENVTVLKAANFYFDGNVSSRTVLFADGSKKTLGVRLPGDYEVGTAEKEIMAITAGDVDVLLPGARDWEKITGGLKFEVPANSRFTLKVNEPVDYCCS